MQDLKDGAKLWRLILTLGWFDIRLRYRGSVLGPFWLTLSTGVMVVALGILYSSLFKMEIHDYLPYLALSIVLWGALSGMVGDACTSFLQAEGIIRSMRIPFTVHAGRTVVRNMLILAHNVVVIAAVDLYFRIWPGWTVLVALPSMLLWIFDGLIVCFLLGTVCARFRDIPPIVASVMQIAFFVSPILWKPELLSPEKQYLMPLNPVYTLLEIVRAPLLGTMPGWHIWLSAVGYSTLLVTAGALVFSRVRGRLAFWI